MMVCNTPSIEFSSGKGRNVGRDFSRTYQIISFVLGKKISGYPESPSSVVSALKATRFTGG